MQSGALRALEFDRIVEAVQTFAVTPMGTGRLAQLSPATDRQEVAQRLAHTSETTRYLATGAGFPLRAGDALPDILAALDVEGRPLEPLRLLALATFLDSVDETRASIRRAPGAFPRLAAVSDAAASFKHESAEARAAIDPSGEVVDHASPELAAIRERLRKQRGRLRSTLESFLRGRDTSKHLQEQVVTERNGRYVLVVKAEHRGAIPGIVHGSSTSGASLFLEPLSTVEINNDIVALEEQEHEEVLRILLALTDAFRRRAEDLDRTIEAAAELDVLQARARFSDSIDGIEPALSTDGRFELQAARHPLMVWAARSGRSTSSGNPANPIPVTIKVIPPSTVLLITGPNTGGKTVALKTAGLLAMMAQAGLRIPAADGSRVPVFQSVFADIGDEQSIDASLSTFSAHISNIVSMDRDLQTPALVLLDEVGSGTDPIEGGALGVAIVERFRTRGAIVVATSHYDALKSYASTTDGVSSAAFGFEPATFAPTYQLIYGSPGRSLALEIAARLGLDPAVVADARRNLSAREAQLAEHLAKMDHDMRALEHEHRLAARERETLEETSAGLRRRDDALRQREETFRRRLNEALETEVRQARRQIDDVIAELKARTSAIAQDASRRGVTTGDTGTVRGEARAAVDEVLKRVAEHAHETEATPATSGRMPAIGDRVLVGGLGLQGVVTSIHDHSADIDVRGKRMRANVRDLRVVADAPETPRTMGTSGTPEPGNPGNLVLPYQGQRGARAARRNANGFERDRVQRRRGAGARRAIPG